MVTRMLWVAYLDMQVCLASVGVFCVVFCFGSGGVRCRKQREAVHSVEHEPDVLLGTMSKHVPSHRRSVQHCDRHPHPATPPPVCLSL